MKKKSNWFLRILFISFIIFLGLYIASISGYYESQVANKVALTEDAIRDFEEDVLNGEVVDINSYIKKDSKDYSNSFTDLGDKFSEVIETFLSDGVKGVWDALKVLFW